MNASQTLMPRPTQASPAARPPEARLPLALSARVTNIVYTAQVQVAYACANQARLSAERAIASLEANLPASPLREMLLNLYRAQKSSADAMAQQLLENARRRCGLAFANYGYAKP